MNNIEKKLPFCEEPHPETGLPVPVLHVFFAHVQYENLSLPEDTVAFSCPVNVEEEIFQQTLREELAKEGDDQLADAAYDRVAERLGAVWDRLRGDEEITHDDFEKSDGEGKE